MKATTALQTNDGMKATTANDGVKGGSVHGEVDAGVHIDKGACVHGDKAVGLHRSRLAEGRSRVAEGRRRPVAAALRHLGHAAGHIVVGVHGGRRPWWAASLAACGRPLWRRRPVRSPRPGMRNVARGPGMGSGGGGGISQIRGIGYRAGGRFFERMSGMRL